MDTNPFEDLLLETAKEIVMSAEQKPLTDESVMFILRKRFNPFPQGPRDTFASLFSSPGQNGNGN